MGEKAVGVSAADPAGLADIIERLEELFQYFCALPHPSLATVIACWVVNTYTFAHFPKCGYLSLRSATPGCGKSRVLELVGGFSLGAPPLMTCPTAAGIFRTASGQVLLLDEVDNLRNQDKQTYSAVIQVLNAGFERNRVVRRRSFLYHTDAANQEDAASEVI